MAIANKYTDFFGNLITSEQAQQLEQYIVQVFNDGVHVKNEIYSKEGLKNILYIINSSSQIDDILQEDSNPSFEISYQQSVYTVVENLAYQNSILIGKTVIVFKDDNEICISKFNVLQDTPLFNSTEKFSNVDDEVKYIFTYDFNGNCVMIYDNLQDQADIFPNTIGVDPDQTFTWVGFKYYQFAEPLIPLS